MVISNLCQTAHEYKPINGTLVHHVYFWLEEPYYIHARRDFEAVARELMEIDEIRSFHFGVPASIEDR